MTRQKRLLLILLGIFVLTLLYGIFSCPRQERVGKDASAPAVRPRPAVIGTISLPDPESQESPEVAEESSVDKEAGVKRNIFAPLYPYVPPPPPPKVILPKKGPAQLALERKPPPPPFRLIGYLENDQRQLFFLAQAKELFIVRREEKFGPDNRYRIVDAKSDGVTIESIDGGETIHLPISRTVSSVEKVGGPVGVFRRPTFQPPPVVVFPVPEPSAATGEELPLEETPGSVDSGTLNTGDGDVPEGGTVVDNGAAVDLPVEEVRDE